MSVRERARKLNLRIGICFNNHDMERLRSCATDEEFVATHADIQESISRVYRSNLAINHSNFKRLLD